MDEPRTHAASPWHPGEVALQAEAGSAARMAQIGPKVIRDHMIEQHRAFYPLLPFIVLGTVDPEGRPWATLRAGAPGFLDAPDPFHLSVAMGRVADDPAEAGLEDGAGVALLGIELATRRRNRLNGVLHREGADGFTVRVEQSFGNCPQYIHRRNETPLPRPGGDHRPPVVSDRLDPSAIARIAAADTFFVASYVEGLDGRRQVDVSHRGGSAGFVAIDENGTLTIPDYSGNRFFNTLGNLLTNPRAGLVFPDFATGDLLQVSGGAEILRDPDDSGLAGAERLWRVRPERVVFRAGALPVRFAPTD